MKPNKSLGQHWLKDRATLDAIAALLEAGEFSTVDTKPAVCLEIGPGLGTLTSSLLKRFDKVLAVEYDSRLAANLPKSFPGKNLEVKNQDFLKFDLESIEEPYVVAGNIPYYITSPIIEKLLTTKNQPQKIVLLIQKEVADRIVELKDQRSLLSLSVRNRAEVTPGFIVPKTYFTPPPKVDSAVIVLTPRKTPLVSDQAISLAKQGFKNPRKKLIKNLPYSQEKLIEVFKKLNLDLNVRPANLTLEDWQNLNNLL